MLYISFAWTTKAFLIGAKSRTRRYWTDEYAKRFIRAFILQEVIAATDRQLRFGGKVIGEIILETKPRREATGLMTEDDYYAEGLAWMEQQGLLIRDQSPHEFFEEWKRKNDCPYIIDFRRIS